MNADSPQSPPPASSSNRDTLGVMSVAVISLVALVFGGVALFMSGNDKDGGGGGGNGESIAAGGAVVSLAEFSISPDPIQILPGTDVEVVNDGAVVHNMAVSDSSGVTSPDLAGGESGIFPSKSLEPGTYEVICTIPGHADAGMKGTLEVTEDADVSTGDTAAGDHDTGDDTDWAALDKAMMDSMRAFPAETEGKGNQKLEYEIAEDGAKVFELTAEVTDWEVSPGEIVEAWSYNGMVPGPWIDVDVGDKVRINVTNKLPMGTDVHWHGIRTPNDQDGVAPYTQDLIEPGETFTYEFTTQDKSVGMYHAHNHGQMQVVNGLFAPFTIGEVELPLGETVSGIQIPTDLELSDEIPMVLNDAGVIGLSLNGKSFPATEPVTAKTGDWKLIHYYNEGLTSHPMHLHQFPQLVVAKDGIPLDHPYFADTINVASGERYSVLVNFTDPGTWVWHCHILTHVESDEGMFGMVTAVIVED